MIPDVSDVPGWLFDDEPDTLYNLALHCDRDILEIGTFQGKSTIILAQALKDNNSGCKVVSVDPLEPPIVTAIIQEIDNLSSKDFRRFFKNKQRKTIIRNIGDWCIARKKKAIRDEFNNRDLDNIVMLTMKSYEVVESLKDEYYGMIFVDGDHTYPSAKTDLQLYYDKLGRGGYMVVHDVNNSYPGIQKAVREEITIDKYRDVVQMPTGSNIVIGTKF